MTTKPYLPKNLDNIDWIGPDDYAYAVSGLIHCLQLPPEADFRNPAPVVVMVHGWGGNESVAWIFKQSLPDHVAIITPRAPLTVDEGSFVWFRRDQKRPMKPEPDTHQTALTLLEKFLMSLEELYPIDPQRLLLLGFSQGGAICNNLVMTRPHLAMGMASLSSFMPPLPPSRSPVDSLDGLPVFIAHGSRDDIIPLAEGQRTRDLYERLGADVTYGEYDVTHKMTMDGLRNLKTWAAGVVTPA